MTITLLIVMTVIFMAGTTELSLMVIEMTITITTQVQGMCGGR
jgi:hypothetical protein